MAETKVAAFDSITISELDAMSASACDALPFGVIGFDDDTVVDVYNATEARLAGLDPGRVLGVPFFSAIAQCMNNFMVAQRFEDESELDAIVPFVLTLRMRPTPVQLRLLSSAGARRRYILVER